jgi:hypothetical protein
VIRVVEVDGEPAVDEYVTEFALDGLRIDAGQPPHVPGADGDGPRAVEARGVEERAGAGEVGCRRPEKGARAVRERETGRAVGERARRGEAGGERLDGARRAFRLPPGESVVLAGQFQQVHDRC